MAIAGIGLLGLLAFGAIYLAGSASQEASRTAAANARAIEKNFQLRRDQAFAKRHAEISAEIGRELEQLRKLTLSGGFMVLAAKVESVAMGFTCGVTRSMSAS
jgi:methyl-accepting chemotaxis protein